MYRLVFDDNFLKSARKLDRRRQARLDQALTHMSQDPFYPPLHTKPLTGQLKGLFPFRLGCDIRVLFKFLDKHSILLITIAKRDAVYRA